MHNAKIVDVDETNMIQIIFKYNNQYNRWNVNGLQENTIYDEKLANIYLKSFINTVQIVKCFIFDKNNYLLIDIVDKGRLTTAVTFIQERTNDIKNKNVRGMTYLKNMKKDCSLHVRSSFRDIIEYDEYIRIIHNTIYLLEVTYSAEVFEHLPQLSPHLYPMQWGIRRTIVFCVLYDTILSATKGISCFCAVIGKAFNTSLLVLVS